MPSAIQFADRSSILLEYDAENGSSTRAVPSPSVRGQVEAALDRGETHYTDRPGILPLREKIAASLQQRFAVPVNASGDLIVTCGVTEARFVAVQQLLQPGQTIAAPALSDRLLGAALLRRVVLQDDVAPGTNMVYLASSISEERSRSLLAKAPAGCLVLFEVDEQENRFHPSQEAGFEDRTVTIGGLGDPGWRLGYLASPARYSPALRDFKQALTICSTNLSQWAALAFEEQI